MIAAQPRKDISLALEGEIIGGVESYVYMSSAICHDSDVRRKARVRLGNLKQSFRG